MRTVAVLYATREGQTRRIAEHVAATLRTRGFVVDLHDVGRDPPIDFDAAGYAATVLAASVHVANTSGRPRAPEAR